MSVPIRVLVVEDSENDTLLLMSELRRGGYKPVYRRVDTPEDLEAALDEEAWDLVVSDHSMPAFNSAAALKLVREKGFEDLPFIIVSGRIGEDVAVEAMKAGAQDYIMKDNLARLISAIERELREAETRRERRRAEKALDESQERFRALVQYASDIIAILDVEGRITYESPAVERILGYKPEERIGEKAFDLIHPDDASRVAKVFSEHLGEPGVRQTVEYRVRARDGSWHYFEAIGNNLLHDPSVRGIVINSRDVTERRQAEEKYRGIFENAVEGIFQTTVDGKLLTANPAMARILGYESPEELLEKISNVADQLYADRARRKEFQRLTRLHGSITGFESELIRKDGSEVAVSLSARALYDSAGGLVGFEGMMEDITERKRADEALREIREAERRRIARDLHDAVLQDLVYTLQSMQISRRRAGDHGQNEELDRQIESLRRAVDGLRDAIYDLRLEGAQEQSLVRSVEALVDLNRQMVPEREIELSLEGSPSDSIAGGAALEMVRIVQEALANVRRHSGAHRVTITLGADSSCVWAEVVDDGRGFDASSSPGVGIAGMKERALALGGELKIEGQPGTGTRVLVRVARASASSGASGDRGN